MTAKLVLTVVDGLKPAMLERAVSTGRAPAMAAVMERGTYVDECAAAFPSVTPACAATIATGVRQDAHHIPSMNWYSREERRYVEYGSSFSASRRFGLVQQLTDTIYNMNATHLPQDVHTVFESLDDLGVRTAGTTYLMYRGRYEHQTSKNTALTRLASTVFRRPVMGPKELFYADIFASRETPCRSQLGLPGIRDQHAGCVGAYLVEEDLFDFLLLSLPDNDTHSHRHGPHAQVTSIAAADRQLERLFHAGGGTDRFLDEHAVIVVADHSHAPVEKAIELQAAYAELSVLAPSGARARDAEIAVCPAQRSAMVYALLPEGRDVLVPRIVEIALDIDGVDLALWRPAPREGAIANATRRAALRRRRRRARRARRPMVDRRPAGGARRARRGRRPAQPRLPRRPRPRVVGAHVPDVRRRPALRRARLRVRRLGWRRPRRRGQPRLAAPRRLARRAGVLRGRRAARPRVVVDRRCRADGARALRRLTDVGLEHLG